MGIIACSINRQSNSKEKIRRIAKILKSEEVGKNVSIKVKWYEQPKVKALSKLQLVPIDEVARLPVNSTELSVEMLWHSASIFKKAERQGPRPNWNGFMENISSGCSHPEKFSITMLPLIDLNPGDESWIRSTLLHIKDLASQMNIETPSINFDQPLWVKAVEIVLAKKLAIVVRLGGFHCLMSFLGSVGTCMEGSGLADLFENVYGKNTVNHIMTRKVISRALRCNYLADSALRLILLELILPTERNEDEVDKHIEKLQSQVGMLNTGDVQVLSVMYDQLGNTDLFADKFDFYA